MITISLQNVPKDFEITLSVIRENGTVESLKAFKQNFKMIYEDASTDNDSYFKGYSFIVEKEGNDKFTFPLSTRDTIRHGDLENLAIHEINPIFNEYGTVAFWQVRCL